MQVPIKTAAELGLLLRATRKTQGLRLDDAAGCAGVGTVFAGEMERGKESVQLGRALKLLAELGIRLTADVPDAVLPALQKLQAKGVRPVRARRVTPSAKPDVALDPSL